MNLDLAFAKLETWGFSRDFHRQFPSLISAQPALSGCEPARVLSVRRGELMLTLGDTPLTAVLAGRFSHQAARAPCVGDFVVVRPPTADGPGRIEALLEPLSLFQRKVA